LEATLLEAGNGPDPWKPGTAKVLDAIRRAWMVVVDEIYGRIKNRLRPPFIYSLVTPLFGITSPDQPRPRFKTFSKFLSCIFFLILVVKLSNNHDCSSTSIHNNNSKKDIVP
jgi:hypothetical protein